MTSTSDWAKLLGNHITTPLPSGFGPVTNDSLHGRQSPSLTNGPERPQDPLQGAYQGAADVMNPMNFYAAGGQAMKGAFELADSKVGQGVTDLAMGAAGMVPSGAGAFASKAMFLAPAQIARLEKAGIRPSNLPRGSSKSLDAMYNDGKRLAKPEETWRDYGWVMPDAWGNSSSGYSSTPLAWHHMDDLELDPKYLNRNYSGPLGDRVKGEDARALYTAEPGIAGVQMNIGQDDVSGPWGQMSFGARPNATRRDDIVPNNMVVRASMPHERKSIFGHEMQHVLNGFADPKIVDFKAIGRPDPGAPAFAKADANINGLMEDFTNGRISKDEMGALTEAYQKVAPNVSYLNSPHEKIARESQLRYRHELPAITTPGDRGPIDTFAQDGIWPVWSPMEWPSLGINGLQDFKKF